MQMSFSELEYSLKKKTTRREVFLKQMEGVIPWQKLIKCIEPHYPSGERGRPTQGIERMLRMYFLQQWFNLADEAVEDAIYDSQAMKQFMGSTPGVPDATTLLKFRHLLEKHKLTEALFQEVNAHLKEKGLSLREGTVVDATIIEAPSSTKNAQASRDPEMHQTKKGNQWHFGMKTHIGVDTKSGLVHTLKTTSANVADVTQVGQLLHGKEKKVYGDAGYLGAHKRDNLEQKYPRLKWEIAMRRSSVAALSNDLLRAVVSEMERRKAQVRALVERPFLIVKHLFRYRKVRYRGLAKNDAHQHTLFALANLIIAQKSLQPS